MAKIQCSQCAYYDNKTVQRQCCRYSINVDKDTICVDCEELDDSNIDE